MEDDKKREYPKKYMKVSKETKEILDELIAVKVGTHTALTRRGRKEDSYNDIIRDLLRENEKMKAELEKLKIENRRLKRRC